MARLSTFRKGGGFLDGVDAVIGDYQFTDKFAGEAFKPGKITSFDGKGKIDKPHTLNCLLSVRVDGAEEDTTTTLKVGNDFDQWEVTDDGHTVSPVEDGFQLSAGTAFYKFFASLIKPTGGGDGFPEERLSEDDINFEPIIGTRVRLIQQVDEERTAKYGQKKDKKTGKPSYDRKDLVVETVYDLPELKTKGKSSKVTATTSKTTKPAGKSNGKITEDEDIDTLAKETLLGILADADGEIAKSKLSMKTLTKLMKHPQREDVRKLIFTDEFLAQQDGWTFNKSKQLVALEE
jgi:hypothetical protein